MAHEAYSPVGYAYNADQFCLDCISEVITGPPGPNKDTYIQDDGCNCAECILDRIAMDRGIDRMDESSYDSSVFPKAISYHNDLHAECQLEESWEPHWCCDARCAQCGDVIDGTERYMGNHEYIYVCPGEDSYLDRLNSEMEEDDE